MKIMTWNVNRFNGTWDYFHNGYDLQQKAREEYVDTIIGKMKEYLVDEDDIVVLQEVPYCIKNYNEWERLWKPRFESKELFTFSNLDIGKKCDNKELYYDISQTHTVAITTNKTNWESIKIIDDLKVLLDLNEDGKRPYVNKYVEMYNGSCDMSLIGVHMNWEMKYWSKLASKANVFSFIVGDFNYNDLLKNDYNDNEKNRKRQYDNILKTHKQLIPEDLITNNQDVSGIDKVFIRNNIVEKCRYSISVMDYCLVREKSQWKIRYSDHNFCICNIEGIR